jgi:hypothetical protein
MTTEFVDVEYVGRLSDKRTLSKSLRRGLRRGLLEDSLVYLRPAELDEINAAVVAARSRRASAVATLNGRRNGAGRGMGDG